MGDTWEWDEESRRLIDQAWTEIQQARAEEWEERQREAARTRLIVAMCVAGIVFVNVLVVGLILEAMG